MLGTVDKALKLLDFFSELYPAIGLSEMARLAGYDKATTRRLLLALERSGMVEQLLESRKYRLGVAPLRLARVRDATYPVADIVQPVLRRLVEETGETAHFSLASGGALATVGLEESPRASRVSLERGEVLPLHATASGIAYLAFSPAAVVEAVLAGPRQRHTEQTVTEPARLRDALAHVRHEGLCRSDHGYETEVAGVAAPVFDASGQAQGAVAVATPSFRMTAETEARIRISVRRAAVDLTRAFGAMPPPALLGEAA
ncbi:MAG TPA: IclR family transcriptional regulator [Alphaproteobacteria bacterium]|nr:IclR family transcriptional regulator [Alphaproteobacteria bacterium]